METDELRERWRETAQHGGGYCPVCDRWGSVYRINLNETMAKSLIWLTRTPHVDVSGWVEVPTKAPTFVLRSNQLPTLKHWGLVERMPNNDPSKKFSGVWRATDKGKSFASGAIRVPKKVYIYNDVVEAWSPEDVSISECFGEYFDYQDAMRATWI